MVDVREIDSVVEWNATYLPDELKDKFVKFLKFLDVTGLSVDEVKVSFEKVDSSDVTGESEDVKILEDIEDTVDDTGTSFIPSIWVLTDADVPLFKPVLFDGERTEFDAAVQDYGIDIIEVQTPQSRIEKTVIMIVEGVKLEFYGNLSKIQKDIVYAFEFPETRLQVYSKVKELFLESGTSSILVDIPRHKNHILLKVK